MESDQEGILSTESDLFDFRQRVRDLVKEMVFMVGASNYFKQSSTMPRISASLSNLISNQESASSWEEAEAELFIVSCLIRDLYEDNETIGQLIGLIVATNSQPATGTTKPLHPQILATCCVILGELSDWLEKNPAFLLPVLNYLLPVITSTPSTPQAISSASCSDSKHNEPITLSSIAAAALQPIIGCCASSHLVGNWELIRVLINICSQLDLILNENAAHNLLHCCSTIISTTNEKQTRPQQEELIVQLLAPPVLRLREVLSATDDTSASVTAKKDPVIYLDRIAAIFRNLHLQPGQETSPEGQLNVAISTELWPWINACLAKGTSGGDSRLVERTCRCLRFVIRCVRPSWLLQDIATAVCTLYLQHPKHSSFLYLASILVDEFAGPEDLPGASPEQREAIAAGLIGMLNAFSDSTFVLLNVAQLRNHPDTIDDFFRLCTR